MKKPKICFVGLENLPVLAPEFNRHNIGGEQVQHTLLAKALARQGHAVSMVVHDYGQPDQASWDQVVTYKAYRHDGGVPVLRFLHPRWSGLWSALRRADADLYYVSCAGMQLGLTALFCRWHRRRVIFRVAHDSDCDPAALLVRYWRDKKLYEYGLRRCDAILVQSRIQQQAMRTNYGLDSQIATMLVDFPNQPPVPVAQRNIDVLWVNNLREFKRPERLLGLARNLPNLRFHMVGGPQPYAELLYRQIRQAATKVPNLTFHGRIPYHDINHQFRRARLLVNTSDSEGFPNSFLQAWARGTPVVSFFDPDGLIEHERLGHAVRSPDAMADSVASLLADRAAWQATSQRCTAFMHNRYREDQVLAPYLHVFQEG